MREYHRQNIICGQNPSSMINDNTYHVITDYKLCNLNNYLFGHNL